MFKTQKLKSMRAMQIKMHHTELTLSLFHSRYVRECKNKAKREENHLKAKKIAMIKK